MEVGTTLIQLYESLGVVVSTTSGNSVPLQIIANIHSSPFSHGDPAKQKNVSLLLTYSWGWRSAARCLHTVRVSESCDFWFVWRYSELTGNDDDVELLGIRMLLCFCTGIDVLKIRSQIIFFTFIFISAESSDNIYKAYDWFSTVWYFIIGFVTFIFIIYLFSNLRHFDFNIAFDHNVFIKLLFKFSTKQKNISKFGIKYDIFGNLLP